MHTDILEEPAGAIYRQLVDLAVECCQSFSLVWRDGEATLGANAAQLSAHLIREARVDSWPGTQLIDQQATIRYFELSDLSALVLKRAPSLFSWQHPQRPEDLAFYANDQVWMASIAHEEQAWFEANPSTLDRVREAIPTLRLSPMRTTPNEEL